MITKRRCRTISFCLFFQWLPFGYVWAAGTIALVPKSGQTISFITGDDGNLQSGVAWPTPRFTDNSDGTVLDNMTNLVWLQQAYCFGVRDWASALNAASTLANGICNLTDGSVAGDWRLPNALELQSLLDYGNTNPALPSGHPFTGFPGALFFWSSSTRADFGSSYAWEVNFWGGMVSPKNKTTQSLSVWAVRNIQ